jgi:pyridoxal phosphate enzyme (YggS family)
MLDLATLRTRLAAVRERIAQAAGRAGRDPDSIRLVAISKTFGVEHIRCAAEEGQVDFGENKLQEAVAKMDATADLRLRWHLVGHLQSNKARKAAGRFDMIHSLDRPEIGRALDEAAAAADRRLAVLAQVDLAGEPTKHGAREEDLASICEEARAWRAVKLVGLMLLPPAVDDPEAARPHFQALQVVRQRLLARGVPSSMLAELSMGMSHDFEVAVEEGATLVRVGSAIFGSRAPT